MSNQAGDLLSNRSTWGARVQIAVAIALASIYAVVFVARPVSWWPAGLRHVNLKVVRWIYEHIRAVLDAVGVTEARHEWEAGAFLVLVTGVIPFVVMALQGRWRLSELGLRCPNRVGWRVVCVGYLLSLPLLWWMVQSPGFAEYYLDPFRQTTPAAFFSFYASNMLGEHFLFHGVLLAACRYGRRWPAPVPIACGASGRMGRILQWVGLAQPTGQARGLPRIVNWLGLAPGCLPAICTSAILFGVIHIGKDPREMLLSLPGGFALAYMAYRTNSWLTPLILHLATAGTAFAAVVLMQQS